MPTLVHTESSMAWGGQEIRVYTELVELPKMGWQAALWAPPESEIFRRARATGVEVVPVPFAGSFDVESIVRVRRLIGHGHIGVVVTHSSIDTWVVGLATRCTDRRHRPAIVRTRHLSTPVRNWLPYRWFPDSICTTSEAIRESLISGGIDPEKIVSIPTGVDTERFRPAGPEEKRAARRRLGLPEGRPLVGGVFVVRSWKGIYDFVNIAAAVPEADFVVAGTGPSLGTMKASAASAGVSSRIHFLGHVESVEDVFHAIDVFLLPSTGNEGVPQALIQAASCGVPMVASRLPSIEEAAPYAQLSSPGDVPGFAVAIRKVLSESERSREMAERCRAETSARYGQGRTFQRIDEFYRRLALR